MSKKILAVALAILFIATAFTACKQKFDMEKIGGKEYPVVTDKNGDKVVNDKNEVAVYATNAEQEIVTNKDREKETYWVPLNEDTVKKDYIQSDKYKLGIPEGWEGSEAGRVIKKDTDGKCYIKCVMMENLGADGTLDDYLAEVDAQNKQVSDMLTDEAKLDELIKNDPSLAVMKGSEYTLTTDKKEIGGNISSYVRIYKIVDKNGNVIHYAENYYFATNRQVYCVSLACEGGVGYDESFNFEEYLANDFTFNRW